jgi:hypothetical protein
MEEQIFKDVDKITSKFTHLPKQGGQKSNARRWTTLKGDICCRVIIRFIRLHGSQTYKAVGPNVWIKGCPTEFDVLMTTPAASPFPSTKVYKSKDVLACLEIKQRGIYGGRGVITGVLNKKKTQFDEVRSLNRHIRCGYLTLNERSRTRKGINYLAVTKQELRPYRVFCLKNSDGIVKNEWAKLLKWLDR